MSLAIITVVYQNYTVFEDFFMSLKKQSSKDFHIFVIDVSTNKQEIDSKGLPVTVVPTDNTGYAHGVNVGVERALSDGFNQFSIVNSDIVFAEDFVEKASASIQNNPKSVIGGKIYYASGYEYHKDRYKENELGKVIWYAGGSIDWDHVQASHRGVDEIDHGQFDTFEQTGFVTGCLVCYDSAAHEAIGAWDSSYFMYYEDTDFSVRAHRAGAITYYDPSIVIWHKNAQSSDGSGSDFHIKHQKKNRIKFGLKYAPLRTKLHLLKEKLY